MASTKDPTNPFVDDLAAKIKRRWSTQLAFSLEAKVDDGGLSRILSRKTNAEPDTLAKMAVALGEDVVEFVARAYMLTHDDHEPRSKRRKSKREEALQRYTNIRNGLTEDEEDLTLKVMETLAKNLVANRSLRS